MIASNEERWGLKWRFKDGWSLLGRYCFPGATPEDQRIKTFRTLRLARLAAAACCYPDAQPVRVTVAIRARGLP